MSVIGIMLAALATGVMSPQPTERTAQSEARGTLAIRAIQGTRGAPQVGIADVEVVLYHRDQVVQQLQTQLDENGLVLVGDLPVAMGVRPLVRIKYAGVLYQDSGPPMDPSSPSASVDVTVYETTDEPAIWRIPMRHVVASRAASGLSVSETVVVENPGDRTWLGAPPDAQNRRTTVSLAIPAGTSDVRLDAGFHGWCCTSLSGNTLNIQMPLMPGRVTYHFSYSIAAPQGSVELLVGAPATIDHAMFFLPDDGTSVQVEEVQPAGTEMVAGKSARMFHAQALPAGRRAGVVVSGILIGAAVDAAEDQSSKSLLAGAIVAGAAVVGSAALFIRRKGFRANPARVRPQEGNR